MASFHLSIAGKSLRPSGRFVFFQHKDRIHDHLEYAILLYMHVNVMPNLFIHENITAIILIIMKAHNNLYEICPKLL